MRGRRPRPRNRPPRPRNRPRLFRPHSPIRPAPSPSHPDQKGEHRQVFPLQSVKEVSLLKMLHKKFSAAFSKRWPGRGAEPPSRPAGREKLKKTKRRKGVKRPGGTFYGGEPSPGVPRCGVTRRINDLCLCILLLGCYFFDRPKGGTPTGVPPFYISIERFLGSGRSILPPPIRPCRWTPPAAIDRLVGRQRPHR